MKKTIAVLTLAILLMLAGCGKAGNTQPTATETQPKATQATEETLLDPTGFDPMDEEIDPTWSKDETKKNTGKATGGTQKPVQKPEQKTEQKTEQKPEQKPEEKPEEKTENPIENIDMGEWMPID